MTDYMRGESQDADVGVRGYWGLNNSIITQSIQPDFALNPGPVDNERDVDINGGAQYLSSTGGYALSGQQFSFETARMIRYRAGGVVYCGSMLVLPDDPPAGHLDFGMGRVPFEAWRQSGTFEPDQNETLLRLTSNGDWGFVIKRNGTETIIPRDGSAASWSGPATDRSWDPGDSKGTGSVIDDQNGDRSGKYWGFDRVDGSGPDEANRSGIDLDQRPIAILPKLIGTWYGKGPWYLVFETAGPNGYQRP